MRISVATSAQAAFSWSYLDKIEVKHNAKISKNVKNQPMKMLIFGCYFHLKYNFRKKEMF